MFRPHTIRTTRPARRGNTLILTLSCLSLLAVVGITAVYFTGDQATRARIQGQAAASDAEFPDNGVGAFQATLSGVIYDASDSGQGLLNSLRGSSLMATMYGRQGYNTVAWDGVGSFSEATTLGIDRLQMVNFKLFPGMTTVYDPEFSNPAGRDPATGPAGIYIPKNAAYTYPDINNLFLASICPATGEILVPSFHRPSLMGATFPATGLEPGLQWTDNSPANAQFRYRTLRPRPADHQGFPPVPPDADGRYRGDVRNRPGGYFYNGQYIACNDSIWIDIGLPAFTLPNGRRVKPLVAPLVLDLDSYLNLNVHGNLLTGGATPAHASGQGLGKWEVSLERVFGQEGRNIVGARGTNRTFGGQTARAYDPRLPTGQQLPSYAQVAWLGGGGAHPNSLNLPGSGAPLFATNPAYRAAPAYDSSNAASFAHPSLRNPNEWTWSGAGVPRSFSLGDALLFHSRHAGQPAFYAAMEAGASAPRTLRGGPHATPPIFGVPVPNPPGQTTTNGHRLDPAHANRGIVTPISAAIDRPGLTPGSGQGRAANAGIAGIDMNRCLADYRANTAAALSPTNIVPLPAGGVTVGTQVVRQAEADRQAFARDIFARLIVATNVPVTDAIVNPDGTVLVVAQPANAAAYNALRNLAQLAANMVDYRDADEVSTAFVWNPLAPADPHNPLNFAAADLTNHVVFGVEKSRLVINEAFGQIVNDPNDMVNGMQAPNGPAHVRFWVELLNPGGGASGPLDDGGAQLREPNSGISPYRIEIARYSRPGAGGVTEDLGSYLQNPANVTGSFDPAYQPEIRFLFDAAAVNAAVKERVLPNRANYNPDGNPADGIALVAANVTAAKPDEFNPTAPVAGVIPAPWTNAIVAAPPTGTTNNNAMAYRAGATPLAAGDVNRRDFKQHVVLLRRLANPHLSESPTNPYVTVDYMDWVPAYDTLHLPNGQMVGRVANKGMGNAGYTPPTQQSAVGKVQPQAGLSVGVIADPAVNPNPTFTFPNSMVLAQTTDNGPNTPRHTFGRHNGTTAAGPGGVTFAAGPPANLSATGTAETVMTPYEWLVHLDRKLINQVELIHVTGSMPHQLTQQFIIPDGAGGVRKHANSLFTGTAATSQLFVGPQMYRALELLRVHSRSEGEAFGGRVQGLININTIQDKRVWDALFDADVNNNIFTQADVDRMWNALMASRSPNLAGAGGNVGLVNKSNANNTAVYSTPIPGATIYDTNTATGDRPFLSFGASTVPPGGYAIGTATVLGGGTGIDDTILRRLNPTTGQPDPTAPPYIFQSAGLHPYQQAEAARKILNSTTTVSNTFAVWVTVGYFDVVGETPSPVPNAPHVTLGNEYFREVPGDTRHKFFAVVDRTKVGLDPASVAAGAPVHANPANNPAGRPFFTTVEANANAGAPTLDIAAPNGQVYSDGVALPITPGATLAIGVGSNREIVRISNISPIANGLSTITIDPTTPLTKNHQFRECVSNVIPGNPGPQANFDVNLPMYQPVVPYWSRVR